MNLDSEVGKVILLNLREGFAKENEALLRTSPDAKLLYGKLVALDEVGLWVENPNWQVESTRDGVLREYKTNVLIPWPAVVSVATFPGRKFDDTQEDPIPRIGFIP